MGGPVLHHMGNERLLRYTGVLNLDRILLKGDSIAQSPSADCLHGKQRWVQMNKNELFFVNLVANMFKFLLSPVLLDFQKC